MMTCAFFPNAGMITEPGPDDCAIGVAGAVDTGPPGLNAGGGGELHAAKATRPAQGAGGSSVTGGRGRFMRRVASRKGRAETLAPRPAAPPPGGLSPG